MRGAYDRCIILLQEVTSWEAADIDKYAIYTQRGCDCAIGVPSHLRSNVERFHNDDCFTAIQIFGLGFVSLHLPHSGRPNDEVFDCMARISALVHSWKSERHPLKYWILGGDLNITLPADLFANYWWPCFQQGNQKQTEGCSCLGLAGGAQPRGTQYFHS